MGHQPVSKILIYSWGFPICEALPVNASMRASSSLLPRLLAVLAAVALCCSYLTAQQTLGGITGEVTDSSGGVIPNATVTVVDEQTALTRDHQDQRIWRLRFCQPSHRHLYAHLHGRRFRGAEDAAHHRAGRSNCDGKRDAQDRTNDHDGGSGSFPADECRGHDQRIRDG